MESKGTEDTEVKFLERINERLAEEVSFLRIQLQQLMMMNQQLLDKITVKESKRAPVVEGDFSPIGGYVSLRQRIEEAEEASKLEAKKAEEDAS